MSEIERAIEKKKYIDADALYKRLSVFFNPDTGSKEFNAAIKLAKELIKNADAADVSEVVHGEWETDRDTIRCSVCGFGYFPNGYFFKDGQCIGDLIFDRCPQCGAKMDGEESR